METPYHGMEMIHTEESLELECFPLPKSAISMLSNSKKMIKDLPFSRS